MNQNIEIWWFRISQRGEVWQRLDLIFIFDFFVCQYLASPSIECNVGFVLHNTSLSCPRSIISGLFQYFFRWLFCDIDGFQLPDEPENLATVFANLDPPKLSCPTQIQMEKNTGANTSTSQIQTANTSENHKETVHLAACGYCHFLPSWTILGCALDKSIFYCRCRS